MAEPLGHYQEQRVGVFVDTQNLYHSARDYYERNVNFESLLRFAVGEDVWCGPPPTWWRRRGHLRLALHLQAFHHRVQGPPDVPHGEGDGEGGRPIYSGNWDMGIAADMVRLMPYLDVVVLGSGDGDFVEILEVLMERGIRVEVIAFRETTAQRLIDAVDRFTHLPEIPGAFMEPKNAER